MAPELTLLKTVEYRGQEITSPRLRDLLAVLAIDVPTGASTARLIEELWPDERPENPAKALQVLISRARSQLGSDLIATTSTGYRLALTEEQVDTSAVTLRASESGRHFRAGNHVAALDLAEAGLAIWGAAPPADGLLDDPVSQLRADRETTRSSLVRTRALALARLGRHDEAIAPLTALVRERPRDEELLAELLRSEAATAGPSAALARYEDYRRSLRDELGTDPGAALQALHQELLQRTTPPVRYGVTHEPNPLVGRDDDIAAVKNLLQTSRVTSIVGPGGLGKTRLAQAVWRDSEQAGAFVALAGVTSDDQVVGEVASAVAAGDSRFKPAGGAHRDLLGQIAGALSPGPALLVLDNCEHVITGASDLVRTLVAMSPDLTVLTTSRAPLDLSSESVYPLPELPLSAAIELFGQRARAARPDVELPDDVVSGLCQRLDGLPLAIELAAARARVMSVGDIVARLDDRFSLLRSGLRDAPERHQTLRAVVEWSWNLLDPSGQAAMRALSVFPDGFTADAVQQVLGDAVPSVEEVLDQLVEQSLLKVSDTPTGTRFRMLETVREFSAAECADAGESGQAITRLLAWARGLGLRNFEAPFGPDPYSAVGLVRAEQDNLSHAIRHALAREDGATVAAITAVLSMLWFSDSKDPRLSGHAEETSWILSHYRPEPDLVEVTRAALMLSTALTFIFEGPRAVRPIVALRRLPAAPPTTFLRAVAEILQASIGEPESLFRLADSDEPLVSGGANGLVSYYWESENDMDRALSAAHRMLDAYNQCDIPWLQALAHARIGELSFQVEHGDQARKHLAEALPVIERLGARADAAGIRWWIVLANLQCGDVDEAVRWMDSIAPPPIESVLGTLGYSVGARAEVHLARGENEAGLQLWRHAVDLIQNSDEMPPTAIPAELDPWAIEARSSTVIAHAYLGVHDAVTNIVDDLISRLSTLLEARLVNPPPYIMEFQLGGTLLLAIAMADLARAKQRNDKAGIGAAVRMIALAERFGFLRNFQPTMSSARVRATAEQADRSAHEEAVSSYADLDRAGLRAAAIAMLRSRPSSTTG